MFHSYQTIIDPTGNGVIAISPNIVNVEWDIYQISISTGNQANVSCACDIYLNGYWLCGTIQGFKDTAIGPPDAVIQAHDILTIQWSKGTNGDTATAAVWYNENPVGSTVSLAH